MNKYPAVIPMIAYENGPAAMDWLARAFGFRERARFLGDGGRLSHGEMEAGDGLIMLATPSPHYHGPKRHREESEAARSEEHTSELQSPDHLVCRLLLEKKKT